MVYNQANTLPASNPSGFSMEGDKANTKPTFWCFLTILPVKMGLKTFCILQFLGDLCFGLINMFVFLLASALLAGGYKSLFWVHLVLFLTTMILGCKFLSATRYNGQTRRRKIQKITTPYNIFRFILWGWTAFIYGATMVFAIKNKHSSWSQSFVYNKERTSGLNLYIAFFVLVFLFAIYQMLLIPIVNIKKRYLSQVEQGSFWKPVDNYEQGNYI